MVVVKHHFMQAEQSGPLTCAHCGTGETPRWWRDHFPQASNMPYLQQGNIHMSSTMCTQQCEATQNAL